MRINIDLPEAIADALEAKAKAQRRTRKNYIEFLCVTNVQTTDTQVKNELNQIEEEIDNMPFV